MISRWVLIAGTGRLIGLSHVEEMLAEELGRLLATKGYGLVLGGWPGVDHVAARAYAKVAKSRKLPLADCLIQVVADRRPDIYPDGADYPDFKGGYVVTVPQGVREWIEAIKYADAVIMLGGEGGTLETYQYSLQEQRPVFPICATGGDAAKAYKAAVDQWESLPFHGVDKLTYIETLTSPVEEMQQASTAAKNIIGLLTKRFDYEDKGLPENMPIFISYAHEDLHWLNKLRSALRPLEKDAKLSIWDDRVLTAGNSFEVNIKLAIENARIAVLLVSDSFLDSDFIRTKELPWILDQAQGNKITVYWIPVQGEKWKSCDLAKLISATGGAEPLIALTPAEQQDSLVKVRNIIARALAI